MGSDFMEGRQVINDSGKDKREIPDGYVPLYVSIDKESLPWVMQNGFRKEDNRVDQMYDGIVEKFFTDEAARQNILGSRTQCVFAYPRHPDEIPLTYTSDVLLEVYVDPTTCVVADGSLFAAAAGEYTQYWSPTGSRAKENISMYAKKYWQGAKTLKEYLSEGHQGNLNDLKDFTSPEVLVPFNIPTEMIQQIPYVNKSSFDSFDSE